MKSPSNLPRFVHCVNLEMDFPTVDEARRRLAEELRLAKSRRVRVMKVIHGYGSSGVGGKLCHALRKSLALRKKEGAIAGYIPGEQLSIFNAATLDALNRFPELNGDSDLERANEGITVVLL